MSETTGPEAQNRLAHASRLLPEVLGLDAEGQQSFLGRLEAEDSPLAAELRGLLEVDEEALAVLDEPAFELLDDSGEDPWDEAWGGAEDGGLGDGGLGDGGLGDGGLGGDDLEDGGPGAGAPPRRIGPYELLGEVGRGGSGVVYRAARSDGEYRREVAIKVLRTGFRSPGLVHRFRAERQILANLRHPHIAVLFEGGTTPDQRPFFVLEYVDGEPIDAYCERRQLPLAERLALVLKVCSAVQYAHQHLVIHRDLKPSNILVDAQGEPKLLDFGIAKLLDRELWQGLEGSADSTLTGLRPMTPQYAAPEQLRGEPITTATDVYGLGLVLYELLTGLRPFELRGPLDFEGQREICEKDPPSPSSRVRRRILEGEGSGEPMAGFAGRRAILQLAGRLSGDLDTILLTALAKDPAQRYPTVGRLADDIQRHLRGLPIRARRATWAYRLGKLVRRRAGTVATLTALLLVSLVFGVEHELQSRRIAAALAQAEDASRVMAEMVLLSSDQSREARQTIPLEVLERGEQVLAQIPESTTLRADLMAVLGRGYLGHQDLERAGELVREAYRLRLELHGEDDPRVAESLTDLASLEIEASRPRRAEGLYRQALAIKTRLLGETHPEVASLTNAVAAALYDQGRMGEAEATYRRALEAKRQRLGDDHHDVAAIRNNLALALLAQGEVEEAEGLFRTALEVSRRSLRETDGQVLAAKLNLAAALEARGGVGEAEALQREVLGVYRATGQETALAEAADRLSGNLRLQGRLGEAWELAEEALEIQRRLRGEGSFKAASAATTLAEVLQAAGQRTEAEGLLEGAVAAFDRLGLDHHRRALEARSLLGICRWREGRGAEAEELLESSHARLEASLGPRAGATRAARLRLAELYRGQGRADDLRRLEAAGEAALEAPGEPAGKRSGELPGELPGEPPAGDGPRGID